MDDSVLPQTHVVFGFGQVGSHLAELLLTDGHRVRVVRRRAGGLPEGLDAAIGDAMDPGFCREATAGATAVYHCMNPAYRGAEWERVLPVVLENLVSAAGTSDARLVVLENLYMFGEIDGPITENTPASPTTRKGEIRARVADDLIKAHVRGDVRAVSGRASDFYGPRGTETHFGSLFWPAAVKGKPASFLPNPDTPHSYHFIPDVATGLKLLGTADGDVEGRPWILPCAPAETSRSVVEHFAQALGKPITLRGMPSLMRRAVGLFVRDLREVGEMLYQWDVPFVVDDSRFRERFAFSPTALADGAERTVKWAQGTYA